MASILILPNEVLLIITDNTPTKELSRLSATSRFFHAIIDPILMRLAQQDYKGAPPLHWAAKYGYAGLIPRLLALGHDVNSEKTTTGEPTEAPIIQAARYHRLSAANILLFHGANPNAAEATGLTALLYAAYNNDLPMTTTLLRHGAHANTKCVGCLGSPLHVIIPYKGAGREVAEELLRAGMEIDFVDSAGDTVLHYSCDTDRNLGDVKWLISKGASINKVNNRGWTALDIAIDSFASSVIKLLRENGAIEWR